MKELDLSPFKELIKNRCGLQFEAGNEAILRRALQERIDFLHTRPDGYYALLLTRSQEFQELVNRLTINETYFFREPEQIALVANRLIPRLLATRQGQGPIRLLSAGCSSGEEPYTIIIALMERYGESAGRLFQVFGCDIDSTALAKARLARYSEFSFRGLDPGLRSRYFHKGADGYHLDQRVRSLVTFLECNLLADTLSLEPGRIDIILFRNVSIYFDAPTRRIILEKLASLLNPDGILIPGTSETMANDLGILHLVEEDGCYIFLNSAPLLENGSRSLPPLSSKDLDPISSNTTLSNPLPCSLHSVPPTTHDLEPVHNALAAKQYYTATTLLDGMLATTPASVPARLLRAYLHMIHK
ncbi:MAG: protein-glutamate O-methyltransferase CheR [Magnetococcales bacterium]|nr:protein-glutamate O-methyltransferase CheR [Magnetococcales bacterium]